MKLSNKILSCLCMLASLLSFSCSPKEGPTSGASKFKVAFVTNNASDFWTIARKGMRESRR